MRLSLKNMKIDKNQQYFIKAETVHKRVKRFKTNNLKDFRHIITIEILLILHITKYSLNKSIMSVFICTKIIVHLSLICS